MPLIARLPIAFPLHPGRLQPTRYARVGTKKCSSPKVASPSLAAEPAEEQRLGAPLHWPIPAPSPGDLVGEFMQVYEGMWMAYRMHDYGNTEKACSTSQQAREFVEAACAQQLRQVKVRLSTGQDVYRLYLPGVVGPV